MPCAVSSAAALTWALSLQGGHGHGHGTPRHACHMACSMGREADAGGGGRAASTGLQVRTCTCTCTRTRPCAWHTALRGGRGGRGRTPRGRMPALHAMHACMRPCRHCLPPSPCTGAESSAAHSPAALAASSHRPMHWLTNWGPTHASCLNMNTATPHRASFFFIHRVPRC